MTVRRNVWFLVITLVLVFGAFVITLQGGYEPVLGLDLAVALTFGERRGVDHGLRDRVAGDRHDHAFGHLELDLLVVEVADGPEDPADRDDLVTDLQRGEQQAVGGGPAPLREDDQQEERQRDDGEVDEDDHGRPTGFLTCPGRCGRGTAGRGC